MYYLDFSGLLTLAVGFNAAYIVVKSKLDNRPFFLWIDKISEFIISTNEKINITINKIGNIKPRIDYFKQHTPMNVAEGFSKKEKKIIRPKNVENKHNKLIAIKKQCDSLEHNTRSTNNLYKIAIISLFYSLYILISAVYEYRYDIKLDDSLVVPNILITIFALTCLLGDWSCIKKHLNKILFAILVIGIIAVLFEYVQFSIRYNHIYTVTTCFIGFIFYFLAGIMGYFISKWHHNRALSVEREIDEIDKMIEKYRQKEDSELEKEIKDKNEIFNSFKL